MNIFKAMKEYKESCRDAREFLVGGNFTGQHRPLSGPPPKTKWRYTDKNQYQMDVECGED